jgi:hypothetical protein
MADASNCLARTHPELAKEWHQRKNGDLTPHDIVAGSNKKVWWQCLESPDHEWQATVVNRTKGRGCPRCNKGWTLEAIRLFVLSLKEHLHTFTPAELYLLFQYNELAQTQGRSKGFVRALATGRFPKEEIEKFVNGEPSLVDRFVQDPTQTLQALETTDDTRLNTKDDDEADALTEPGEGEAELQLPVVETRDVLGSLALHLVTSADEEAIEFLLASAVAKLWKHAYQDETAAVAQAASFSGEGYAEQARSRFLDEYRHAKDLLIPTGYAFPAGSARTRPLSQA